MRKLVVFTINLLLLSGAGFCLAADFIAGTDGYLVANGLTETQLTTNVATEDREPFISAVGETTISDPTADVVSRTGTHPTLNYGWADLTSASLKKNETNQCWLFTLQTAEDIPTSAPWQANFLLYIDHDADTSNNAPQGVRINTDYEIAVKYGTEDENIAPQWFTDFRWYNPEPDFWATDKETASTFEFKGNQLNICVPFSEISSEVTPTWRAAAVGSDGKATQIDVVPGAGFPPPLGETYPTWDSSVNSTNYAGLINWASLGIVLTGIAVVVVVRRKKKQNKN
jgi:hypothetical protein